MGEADEGGVSRLPIDEIPVGVFVTDADGNYVEVNPAACAMVGYDREDLLSMSVADLTRLGSDASSVAAFDELRRTGEVRTEAQLWHRDGDTVDVLLEATTLEDGLYVAYCQDVSERKEYERLLEESEARHRSMSTALDTSSVGTFILDADFQVVWISEAVERFFGISKEDVVGTDKASTIRSDIKHIFEDPERFAETVVASYEDNTYVESFTCHVLPGDGREERWLLHWSSPIERGLYEGGRIEHYTDVTESVQYERQLEGQRDNLSVLNQVMRHDIRNDLQQVLAHGDMLLDVVDEAHRSHVETILENAEEAVELTDTARETAELMLTTDTDHRPMNLETVVDGELEDVRNGFRDADFVDETALSGVTVRADEMLHSVFRNLLKNAVQHNDRATPEIVVTSAVGDETVQVRVADNGPGVPDDRKADIFGKGEKGLESAGTGLGLYLVRTLVEGYGGTVRVEDRADADGGTDTGEPAGAVFVVELPRVD